jgi:RNA polymerase sigma-70 factor (sigma-E family)
VPDDGLREFLSGRLAALSRTAYLLTGDHHAAEDLLQNALVIVAARWHPVAAAGDPVAYARRILYHEHISSWRRNRYLRAEYSTADVPDRGGPRDMSGDVVRRVVLERALAKLTPRQRAVIVARFYEDLTEVDAASALGCSVGTIKSQTHHALGRLRELAPELADLVHHSLVEVAA